jgi:hypothetical protein
MGGMGGMGGTGGIGGGQECTLCPVCALLQAVDSTRPEVLAHLYAAGRELATALRLVAETHLAQSEEAADRAPTSGRLRRIEFD